MNMTKNIHKGGKIHKDGKTITCTNLRFVAEIEQEQDLSRS